MSNDDARLVAAVPFVEDMAAIDAVRSVGAGPVQVSSSTPSGRPSCRSSSPATCISGNSYIRDSTILGIIGAGGLGLLISEATSLFQWGRLSTVLLVVFLLVTTFDALSRRIRKALL